MPKHHPLRIGGLGVRRVLRGGNDTQQAVILVEARSEKERAEIAAHWPLDDMDETEYMQSIELDIPRR